MAKAGSGKVLLSIFTIAFFSSARSLKKPSAVFPSPMRGKQQGTSLSRTWAQVGGAVTAYLTPSSRQPWETEPPILVYIGRN